MICGLLKLAKLKPTSTENKSDFRGPDACFLGKFFKQYRHDHLTPQKTPQKCIRMTSALGAASIQIFTVISIATTNRCPLDCLGRKLVSLVLKSEHAGRFQETFLKGSTKYIYPPPITAKCAVTDISVSPV